MNSIEELMRHAIKYSSIFINVDMADDCSIEWDNAAKPCADLCRDKMKKFAEFVLRNDFKAKKTPVLIWVSENFDAAYTTEGLINLFESE